MARSSRGTTSFTDTLRSAKSKSVTKSRSKILNGIFFFVFLMLVGRLYYLQVGSDEGEKYRSKALSQQHRMVEVAPNRGTIYDRNMKPLAVSATVWDVILAPANIKDEQVQLIADFLSEELDVDRDLIVEKAKNKGRYYERVKAQVEKDTFDRINQFISDNKVTGIDLIENTKRYYPYGDLASTVLGFTGDQNKGAYGLESYYERVLAGTPGKIVRARDSKGRDIPQAYQQMYLPENGNSIVLTIDEVVQHFLEKHLELAVVEYNVQNRAAGIVMNIKTGEILAMASAPDFDPNSPRDIGDPVVAQALAELKPTVTDEEYQKALQQAQFDQWRNKAISDPYEPGSVFKVITAAAALDSDTVPATGREFFCPGYHIVAGRRKGCWKRAGHGSIDFTHAIKYSCNPAFMMVGEMLGAELFDDYFERFGFKETTKIDLPGEADGIYYPMELLAKPSGEELASSSFGQTFKVTPIQLITAVAASVNGNLMQPYIVKEVLDPDGNIVSATQPQIKRQVVSEETAKELALILERVVGDPDGSGKHAYVPGYRIGGKTGTSEKLDKRVDGQVVFNIASFCGIAPSNDPEIACLVLLDEPIMQTTFGSMLAAPVVGAVMADTLDYLGITPQYSQEELEKTEATVPDVRNIQVHYATSFISTAHLKYRIVGEGTTVISQVPAAYQKVPKDSTVILYTSEETLEGDVEVPNVLGLQGLQANKTITNNGLNIKIMGDDITQQNSVAVSQDPAPGTFVPRGTIVTVTFGVTGTVPDSTSP